MKNGRQKYLIDAGGQNIIHLLLCNWDNLLKRYEQAWKATWPDGFPSLHIYNEQAQVGLLAFAAIEAGWLPFLEFSVDRKGKSPNKCRCDMSFLHSPGTKGEEVWIEAGHVWVPFDIEGEALAEKVVPHLRRVRRDVKSIKEAADSQKFALVFVQLNEAPEKELNHKRIWKQVKRAKDLLHADFCALHLCEEEIRRVIEPSSGRDCPGIAIIGKCEW